MKKTTLEIRRGNVTVNIYTTSREKKGRVYTSYVVDDYSAPKRKQWSYAAMEEAKEKAKSIAECIRQGMPTREREDINYRMEIRSAQEALAGTGLRPHRAAELLATANYGRWT